MKGGCAERPRVSTPDEWFSTETGESAALLEPLRELILATAPDLQEVLKWGYCCYKGNSLVIGLGAFKKHVGIVFHRGAEQSDPAGLFNQGLDGPQMRTIRLDHGSTIPVRPLRSLIVAAVALDQQPKLPKPMPTKRPLPSLPEVLSRYLEQQPQIKALFDALAPSHQREHIAWIANAKKEETITRRLEKMAEMLKAKALASK